MVFNGRDTSLPIQQTGHSDLIQRPDGKWYTVFLAVRPQLPTNIDGTYQLGRETFLSPVTWSQDGWQLANNGSPITFAIEDLDLPTKRTNNTTWVDDFSSPELITDWEFRGTPYGNWHRIENSSLILRGTPRTLSALDGIALITKRQDDLLYSFRVDIEFRQTLETHEAGITAWMNDEYHNSISMTLCPSRNNTMCLKTKTIAQGKNINGNETTIYTPLSEEQVGSGAPTVRLHIRATPDAYQIGYSATESKKINWLTVFTASWMAPRSRGRIPWQGARVGTYATGNGVPMLKEATFRHVETMKGSNVQTPC